MRFLRCACACLAKARGDAGPPQGEMNSWRDAVPGVPGPRGRGPSKTTEVVLDKVLGIVWVG